MSRGALQGEPVRAFLLAGADSTLAEAFPWLVGWQRHDFREAVERAIRAGHPLIALDALHIAAKRSDSTAEVKLLAELLLHPTQPPRAKLISLDLLARAVERLEPDSAEANSLIELTAWTWRLERQYSPEAAYLEAWQALARHIRASDAFVEIMAMALDETAAEQQRDLRRQLRELLRRADG